MNKPVKPPKPLKVEVSGGTEVSNTLVFGIVQNSLREAGFSEVEALHPYGDTASIGNVGMTSMLDVLSISHPKLFTTPVTVKQNLKGTERDMSISELQIEANVQPLVENMVYGFADYEGRTQSNAAIFREEQAKAFVAKVREKYPPPSPEQQERNELAQEEKFLKHMKNPAVREAFEEMFDDKVKQSDIDELQASVDARRKNLREHKVATTIAAIELEDAEVARAEIVNAAENMNIKTAVKF